MISKVLFRNVSNNNFSWQMIHYFASAVSLVLVGIHVGLHWNFVMGMFRKFVKIPKMIAKPLSIILAIAVILFGSYSVSTSGFTRWITAPFSVNQSVNFEGRQRPSDFNFDNKTPAKGESQTDKSNLTKPQPKGGKLEKGDFPSKREGGADPLGVIVTFTSIIGAFAALTYYIEKLLRRVMLQNIHN